MNKKFIAGCILTVTILLSLAILAFGVKEVVETVAAVRYLWR